MADLKKQPPKDRTREIESLAANLFAQATMASRGSRTPEHLAREAITAARAFYAAIDGLDVPPVREPAPGV